MLDRRTFVKTSLAGAAVSLTGLPAASQTRQTVVSIDGQEFRINGEPTYPGCEYNGMKVEGLLMNARLVQGVFDDRNPETVERWAYPDTGEWDAERNTREFIAAMPSWLEHGMLAFTINFQGGSPEGYSRQQPWHNSAFEADGSLRDDYAGRMKRIIDEADRLGMVVILGYFYFGQDQRLEDEAAVIRAVENATDFVTDNAYTNVIIEIGNEVNLGAYRHEIIKVERCPELIELVKERSQGKVANPINRLYVSTSLSGGQVPGEALVAAGDFHFLHGNGVDDPDRIRQMVDQTRARSTYNGEPIINNEDDHYDFDKPDNNMLASVSRYASWGYFDFRRQGESFEHGFQSVPVDWTINSPRKKAFFDLLAKVTCNA